MSIKSLYGVPIIKNIILAVFFGGLSYLLGMVKFDIPGYAMNDFREIPLLISIFYIKNPLLLLLEAGISSFGVHTYGSALSMFIMHSISIVIVSYVYNFFKKLKLNKVRLSLIWFIISVVYYLVLLIPLSQFIKIFLGIQEQTSFSYYLDIISGIRFEVFSTSIITTLYLIQHLTTISLQKHKSRLEITVKERTKELIDTNEELNATNNELSVTLKKLKKTQQNLILSEKLSSLGMFATGIAHEINNPLNYIQGGILAIEKHFKGKLEKKDKKIDISINAIKIGVEKASKIVKSLNHFNKNDDSVNNKCDLHLIIDNCLLILDTRLKSKAEIKKTYTNADFILFGNEGKLHQAIINILTNAEQAIEKNGIINIKTEKENHHVKILISDTGCGIGEDAVSKVFDPFFTTKPAGEGAGLGLSITNSIIQEHNGTFTLKTKQGKGTTFTIKLPVKILGK